MRDLIRRDARRAAVAKRAWRGVEDFAEMARSDGSAMDSDEKVMADIDTAGREAMDSMLFALGLPAAPSPEDEYLDRELRAELIEAVRHLPTDFQRVVEARFGEERELDGASQAERGHPTPEGLARGPRSAREARGMSARRLSSALGRFLERSTFLATITE